MKTLDYSCEARARRPNGYILVVEGALSAFALIPVFVDFAEQPFRVFSPLMAITQVGVGVAAIVLWLLWGIGLLTVRTRLEVKIPLFSVHLVWTCLAVILDICFVRSYLVDMLSHN